MRKWTNDLINATVKTAAGPLRVTDLLLDAASRRVRYIVLDTGGWVSRSEAMVAVDRLQPPTEPHGDWTSDLTTDALAAAPRLDESGGGLDLSDWPPLITGPFGTTHSPMLLATQLMGMDGPPAPTKPGLSRITGWTKAPVFGREGEIGQLGDFLIDMPDGSVRGVRLEQDKTSVELSAIVLRNCIDAPDGPYVVTDMSASELEQGRYPLETGGITAPEDGWVQPRSANGGP